MKRSVSILFIAVLLSSCKKYEEGSSLTFRTAKARLTGTWDLTSFYVNGIDSTINILNDSCYSFYRIKAKSEKVIFREGECPAFIGYWDFSNNYNNLNISSRFILSQTNISTTWNILRLTNKEMWLETKHDTSLYYATFKKIL